MVWINVKRPTPSKESAVNLAFLAYILDKAAPFYGKTKIVKTAFRVELALRDQGMIGPTFRFYRYKKGPFSVELLNAYDTLWSRGFAKNFALTERGKRLSKFMETLKRIPHNRSVFNVMDAALERCRIQHGSRMMDDLYEIRVRPEDGKDKVVLKDIPMNTDIVAPKGDPTVNIPAMCCVPLSMSLKLLTKKCSAPKRIGRTLKHGHWADFMQQSARPSPKNKVLFRNS